MLIRGLLLIMRMDVMRSFQEPSDICTHKSLPTAHCFRLT